MSQKQTSKQQKLTELQEEAVRLVFIGKKHQHAARELGVSSSTLSNWKKKEWWSEAMADYQNRVREKPLKIMAAYKEVAAMTMVALMSSDNPFVKLKASQEVLNFGEPKETRLTLDGLMGIELTVEEKIRLYERKRQKKKQSDRLNPQKTSS